MRVLIIPFTIIILLTGCAQVTDVPGNGVSSGSGEWLIPADQIFDGGPGKDGIPAINNPNFIRIQDGYFKNGDLVLLHRKEEEIYAYPHPILDWHEIINHQNINLSVTYCPLTGSAVGFSSLLAVEGSIRSTTFGVSGLLYNTNLILYDRLTSSYWAQMRLQCVAGALIQTYPELEHLVETRFDTALRMYPQLDIVSKETGIYSEDRYGNYPYGDYRTNDNSLIFPVSPDDRRLPGKERVLGVLGDSTGRIYQFRHFSNTISLIHDQLDEEPIVVIGSSKENFMIAFYSKTRSGEALNLTVSSKKLPYILQDENGGHYDIFGWDETGSKQLLPTKSFIAYWFAFGAFYPGIEIYGN